MMRIAKGPLAAGGLLVLAGLAAPGATPAQTPAASAPQTAGSWVRVSLDPEDPFAATIDDESSDLLRFYVFMKGRVSARGIDYGLLIEGGQYIAYTTATDRAWATLPVTDGFPSSIGQAISGPDCIAGPIWLGTLLVKPDEPGQLVKVTPTQSMWSQMAYLLDCTNQPMYSFTAYGAAVNGRPDPPRLVRGDVSSIDDIPAKDVAPADPQASND